MNHSLIEEAARRAGITLSEEQIFQVDRYVEHLKEENQKFNLTSIIEDEAIAIRHLEDSWHAASLFKKGSSLLDVGTGAGFPGLALKIVRPDLEITLLDATGKKVTFLQDTIRLLDLHGVSQEEWRQYANLRFKFSCFDEDERRPEGLFLGRKSPVCDRINTDDFYLIFTFPIEIIRPAGRELWRLSQIRRTTMIYVKRP